MRLFCFMLGYMKSIEATGLFSAIVEAPFGAIGIRTEAGVLRELVYLPSTFDEKSATDKLAEVAARQIKRYLVEPDFRFDLPLAEVGTAFQHKVWAAIASIPRGEVRTYGQVAKHIQSAPRAVGQAEKDQYRKNEQTPPQSHKRPP